MRSPRTLGSICLLGLLAALPISAQPDRRLSPAQGARRVALVVGNDTYRWGPLTQAVRDARLVRDALTGLGFTPSNIHYGENLGLKEFQRLRRQFLDSLRGDDLAFVYYSGHGVEALGVNYLLPVDFAQDATESQVADEAISAQELLTRLQDNKSATRIVILDACRNNPLRKGRAVAGGLAPMAQINGRGTLVMFAAESGRVAADSGLFRRHLIDQLRVPGLSADEALKRVARAVDRESSGKQTPAIYGLLLDDFAFSGTLSAAPPPSAITAPPQGPRAPENLYQEAAAAQDARDFQRALPLFRSAAAAGNADAMHRLGMIYWRANGVDKDVRQASQWLEKAAAAGKASSMNNLAALILENPDQFPSRRAEVGPLFVRAARAGAKEARRPAARFGDPGSDSDSEWFGGLKECAELGDEVCMVRLGYAYSLGQYFSQSYSEAFRLYQQSAEKGECEAMKKLAQLYGCGKGVRQDFPQFCHWMQKAKGCLSQRGQIHSEVNQACATCNDNDNFRRNKPKMNCTGF
jgi:uncharacterized caspase-like protein